VNDPQKSIVCVQNGVLEPPSSAFQAQCDLVANSSLETFHGDSIKASEAAQNDDIKATQLHDLNASSTNKSEQCNHQSATPAKENSLIIENKTETPQIEATPQQQQSSGPLSTEQTDSSSTNQLPTAPTCHSAHSSCESDKPKTFNEPPNTVVPLANSTSSPTLTLSQLSVQQVDGSNAANSLLFKKNEYDLATTERMNQIQQEKQRRFSDRVKQYVENRKQRTSLLLSQKTAGVGRPMHTRVTLSQRPRAEVKSEAKKGSEQSIDEYLKYKQQRINTLQNSVKAPSFLSRPKKGKVDLSQNTLHNCTRQSVAPKKSEYLARKAIIDRYSFHVRLQNRMSLQPNPNPVAKSNIVPTVIEHSYLLPLFFPFLFLSSSLFSRFFVLSVVHNFDCSIWKRMLVLKNIASLMGADLW
jgi:hypothetical protein